MTNWLQSSEQVLFGTNYGGWTLPSTIFESFHAITVFSCGVGEDISFDNQLLIHSDWDIILVDPTPRAKVHYLMYLESIKRGFSLSINNSNETYAYLDESKAWPSRLKYIEKALVANSCAGNSLTMHEPRFATSVCHSAENRLLTDVGFIAESLSLCQLLEQNICTKHWAIKMDIEGSEWGVVQDILDLPSRGFQLPVFACIEVHKLSSSTNYQSEVNTLIESLASIGLELYRKKGDDLTFVNTAAA